MAPPSSASRSDGRCDCGDGDESSIASPSETAILSVSPSTYAAPFGSTAATPTTLGGTASMLIPAAASERPSPRYGSSKSAAATPLPASDAPVSAMMPRVTRAAGPAYSRLSAMSPGLTV